MDGRRDFGDDDDSASLAASNSQWSQVSGDAPAAAIDSDLNQDLLEQDRSIQAAIFGAVYKLSSVKLDGHMFVAFLRIVLEYSQLFLLLVDPDRGWRFSTKPWSWRAFRWLLFINPIIDKGYDFYIALLYVAVILVVFCSVSMCVFAWRFLSDLRQPERLVTVVRWLMTIFAVYLQTSVMSLFVAAMDCRPFARDPQLQGYMHLLPAENCTELPHIIHLGFAGVAFILFSILSTAMSISDFDSNPASKNFLAQADSFVNVGAVICKSAIVAAVFIIQDAPKFRALLVQASTTALLYLFIKHRPHYSPWANHIRTALYGSLMWISLMFTIMAFTKKGGQEDPAPRHCTKIMLIGLLPSMALFGGYSYATLSHYMWEVTAAFSNAPANKKPADIFAFEAPMDVEVASRCCRYNRKGEVLDAGNKSLCETILKAGTARFPKDPFMAILNANFLMEVQGSYQTGYSQLVIAKKLRPGFSLEYFIFSREQEHRHRAGAQSGRQSSVDLATYIEFQRNYKLLMRRHKDTLKDNRAFWRLLLQHDIKFTTLIRTFKKLEATITQAAKTYQMVLERHPLSVKLLRSYAAFLDEAMNDPWRAARYYVDADKLEQQEEEEEGDMRQYDDPEDTDGELSRVNEKTTAVIVINSTGIIQIINKIALQLLGYKKGELDGKNVSLLMPPPFSQRHHSYLANFIKSGRDLCLEGKPNLLVALHKDRYVIPVQLQVSRVSGIGSDSVFMGVITPEPITGNIVRLWVATSGLIVCVDSHFTDWFAISPNEVVGANCTSLLIPEEASKMTKALERAQAFGACTSNESFTVPDCLILHKYLDPIRTEITWRKGGTDHAPIYILEIQRSDSSANSVMITNKKGIIEFATAELSTIFGYQPGQMLGVNMSSLMPPPFNQLHSAWMKHMTGRKPATSCRNGIVVSAASKSGAIIPVKLTVDMKEIQGSMMYIANVSQADYVEARDQRRLRIILDKAGHVLSVSKTPAKLFGFKPTLLLGRHISTAIDILNVAKDSQGLAAVESLLMSMGNQAEEHRGISWRVGVLQPLTEESVILHQETKRLADAKPAVMQVELLDDSEEQAMEVQLFRAEMLTAVIEVELDGSIAKAGACPLTRAGPLFGCSTTAMTRQPITNFLQLGPRGVDSLLFAEDASKKGNLKNSAQIIGWQALPPRVVNATHSDGHQMACTVQGTFKGNNMRRVCIRVSISNPSCGHLPQLHSAAGPEVRRHFLAAGSSFTGLNPAGRALGAPVPHPSLLPATQSLPAPGRAQLPILWLPGQPSQPSGLDEVGSSATARNAAEDGAQLDTDIPKPTSTQSPRAIIVKKAGVSFADVAGPNLMVVHLPSEDEVDEPCLSLDLHDMPFPVRSSQPGDLDSETDSFQAVTRVSVQEAGNSFQNNVVNSRVSEWINSCPAADKQVLAFQNSEINPITVNPDEPDMFHIPVGMYSNNSPKDGCLYGGNNGNNNNDVMSTVSDDQMNNLMGGDKRTEYQCDFKRGKRCKKITKLLLSSSTQAAVMKFSRHLYPVLLALLVSHLVSFCTFSNAVNDLTTFVADLNSAARANEVLHRAGHAAEVIRNILHGVKSPYYGRNDLDAWVSELQTHTRLMLTLHHRIYLGKPSAHAVRPKNMPNWPLLDLLEQQSTPWLSLVDANPSYTENRNMSLWDGGNELISAFKEIYSNWNMLTANGTDLASTRHFSTIRSNGPEAFFNKYRSVIDALTYQAILQIENVKHIGMILLVLEGCVICTLAAAYAYWLLGNVSQQRYNLFSIFLMVPTGCLRALATKQLQIGAEEDDDDEFGQLALEGAKPGTTNGGKDSEQSVKYRMNFNKQESTEGLTWHEVLIVRLRSLRDWATFSGKAITLNKKRLICNAVDTYFLLLPFIAWMAVIIVCFACTYNKLEVAASRVMETSLMANGRVRVSRILYFSHRACSETNTTQQELLIHPMLVTLARLENLYRVATYGGPSNASMEQYWNSGSTAFAVPNMANLLFNTHQCLNPIGVGCTAIGDQYYEVFHSGLDAMLRRYLIEARLMSQDNIADVNMNSTRLRYIWSAGRKDLLSGMTMAATMLEEMAGSIFAQIISYHILVFAMSWPLAITYILGIMKPFLRRNQHEVHRMADMLSQLPPDIPVDELVDRALFPRRVAAKLAAAKDQDATFGKPRRSINVAQTEKCLVAALELDGAKGNKLNNMRPSF